MFARSLQEVEHFTLNDNDSFEYPLISNDTPVSSNFDPCTQPPEFGSFIDSNKSFEKRYYFDRTVSMCIPFSYKGSGGNYNNFKKINDCEETCGSGKRQLASCFEQYTNGTGNMRILRYYYDYKHRACKSFFYKGHNGNNNRFVSRKQCNSICIISLEPKNVFEKSKSLGTIRTTLASTTSSTTTTTTTTTTTSQPPTTIITTTTQLSFAIPRLKFNSLKNINSSTNEDTFVPKVFKVITVTQPPQQFPTINNKENNWYVPQERTYQPSFQNVYYPPPIYQPYPQESYLNPNHSSASKPTLRRRPTQEITSTAYKEFVEHINDKELNENGTIEDTCKLPLQPGTGKQFLQRWYYNPSFHNCIPFFYKGHNSNGNNFHSKNECIKACIHHEKPIIQPRTYSFICPNNKLPLLSLYNKPVVCSKQATCPEEIYFCSIDNSNAQGHCCPKSEVPICEQDLITGIDNKKDKTIMRYYFNKDTYSCTSFQYTGFGGNENNFLTIADCRKACPEYINPCPIGIPFISKVNENVAFCSHINQECPPNYWCHIGGSKKTSVCCPMLNENALNEDPCSMNLIIGEGDERLSRYFYNKRTKQCENFIYLGKRGNSNNFYTKTDCEAICPIFENPCGVGSPFFNTNGGNDIGEESQPLYCSTIDDDTEESSCPNGYYCHIGASSTSTVCCPITGDPCDLPVVKGNGTAVLNRWYFNSKTKVCSSFVYSGMGGNINNFLSKEDCSATCDEMINPCPTGQPHITLNGDVTHCGYEGSSNDNSCPPTYWCHYGSSYETSTCCPNAGDPCVLEMEKGEGDLEVVRYYYDFKTRKCKRMNYLGMKGNQNLFLTLAACESRCPVFKNPCLNGEPEKINKDDVKFCSITNPEKSCSKAYYCHIGYSEESTVCCPKISDNPCLQPNIRGGGPASLSRYYYDSITRTCLPFIYSGANGNMNNFVSKDECESKCPVLKNPCSDGQPATDNNGQYIFCVSRADNNCPSGYFCHYGEFLSESVCCPGDENPCNKTVNEGKGDKEIIRWYFDNNLRRCSKFKYRGKAGNSNNFITLQECQMTCKEYQNPCSDGDPALNNKGGIIFCNNKTNTCPSNYFCHHGAIDETTVCCPLQQESDPCYAPLSIGTGVMKLPRWYFNHHTKQCLQFTYTSINGNANNYLSEEECANKCPVAINPCPGVDRVYPKSFADSLKCSADRTFVCPIGYWCHLGSSPESSICCPNAQDPCKQNLELGVSLKSMADSVKRWYYDKNTKECKSFIFRGLKGNQNNFITKSDCIKTCPGVTNVCQIGEPYRDKMFKTIRKCDTNKDCPLSYFCHKGSQTSASKPDNVCCQTIKPPCQSEVSIGNGKYSLPRWYFNDQKKQCIEFTYSGSGGTANNFMSKEECTESCLHDKANPCAYGEAFRDFHGSIKHCTPITSSNFYNSPSNECPPNYFCHVGENEDTTICCPLDFEKPLNPCDQSMESGYGNRQLSRYYYNYYLTQCLPFIYTGMGGNSNNFLSKEDCMKTCLRSENYFHSSSIDPSTPIGEWPWYTPERVKRSLTTLSCGMPKAKSCKNSPIGYFYDSMSHECAPIRPCANEPLDNIFWNINECSDICNRRSEKDKEEDYLLIRSMGFLSKLLGGKKGGAKVQLN
uniref:Kunitz/Bovine pancreatic trypsin inhibitor domain protein n=1 Tax=Parastrongyloides trichosuri TaxID=131310 RepID=A0A0N4Z452_PARTI